MSPKVHGDICQMCTNRHAGWFCNLSPVTFAAYDALGIHRMVPAGGKLFHEGGPARSVSILCSGQVKLTTSSREGKTLLVRLAMPGDVLGLSATMSGTPHETTAEAVQASNVKCFAQADFLKFLEEYIEGSMNAALMLNREYRDALADATRLALSSSVSGRVARLLLQMASACLDQAKPGFKLMLTHEELATMLGTTRESVTRVLNEFKRREMIVIHGTFLTITRRNALELLA
jgi:CRP/FNR family transcriptional regulator, cyclic AMP receptor protein